MDEARDVFGGRVRGKEREGGRERERERSTETEIATVRDSESEQASALLTFAQTSMRSETH